MKRQQKKLAKAYRKSKTPKRFRYTARELSHVRATASPYDCGGNPIKEYPGE